MLNIFENDVDPLIFQIATRTLEKLDANTELSESEAYAFGLIQLLVWRECFSGENSLDF